MGSPAAFPPHDPNAPFSFPAEEEKVLAYWNSIDAFQTSLSQSKAELDSGLRTRWNFYDGPPFATGLPHYGHLLMGTVKVSPVLPTEHLPSSGG